MDLPVMNHFLPQGLLIDINFQPPFWIFPCVPWVMVMVAKKISLRPLLTQSLLDLFSGFQVFHRTTLRFFVIILINHYIHCLYVQTTYRLPVLENHGDAFRRSSLCDLPTIAPAPPRPRGGRIRKSPPCWDSKRLRLFIPRHHLCS